MSILFGEKTPLTSTNSAKRVELFCDGVLLLWTLVLGVDDASDWMQDSTSLDSARSRVRPLPGPFTEPLEAWTTGREGGREGHSDITQRGLHCGFMSGDSGQQEEEKQRLRSNSYPERLLGFLASVLSRSVVADDLPPRPADFFTAVRRKKKESKNV